MRRVKEKDREGWGVQPFAWAAGTGAWWLTEGVRRKALPGSSRTRDGTNVGAEFGEEHQRVEEGPEVGAVAGVDGFYVG